jgi:hypothetical protein
MRHAKIVTRHGKNITLDLQKSPCIICVVKYEAENGQIIIIVAIYISPNQTIEFTHENLVI